MLKSLVNVIYSSYFISKTGYLIGAFITFDDQSTRQVYRLTCWSGLILFPTAYLILNQTIQLTIKIGPSWLVPLQQLIINQCRLSLTINRYSISCLERWSTFRAFSPTHTARRNLFHNLRRAKTTKKRRLHCKRHFSRVGFSVCGIYSRQINFVSNLNLLMASVADSRG